LPVYSIILAGSNLLSGQLTHKFSLVGERAFARDQFKIFMKAGKVIKAAFVTKLFNAQVVFNKKFTGMAHPDLDEELRVSFPGS
jgi:hypothetical protein